MSSRRRLYLNLKQSVTKLFKTPAHYLKEITGKQSIFEKPYLDDDYRQMHLNLPVGRWKRPEFDPGGIWPLPRKHTFIFDDGICSFFGRTGDCGETISLDGYMALTPLGTLNRKYVWSAESSNPVGAQIEEIELSSGGLSASVKVKLADDFTGTVTICAKASLAAGAFLKEIAYEVPAFLGRVRICPGWIPSFDYARKNLPPIYEVWEKEREWDCGCVDLKVVCECTGATWDDGASADTVAQSSSCTVAIADGGSETKTWSVGGTGFWLDAGFTITSLDTSANSITLYTDASACGSATITACGATGHVRCTTGTWVYKPAYDDQCLSSGGGSYVGSAIYRKTYGNKRLDQTMGYAACTSYPKNCNQSPTCPGTTGCGAWTSDTCLPWDCTFIYGATGVQCNEGCCNHTCVSSAWAYCPYIASIKNYEWEC